MIWWAIALIVINFLWSVYLTNFIIVGNIEEILSKMINLFSEHLDNLLLLSYYSMEF